MRLNSIKPARGARRPRKRVGRGTGSGLGKTCGRGHKGQRSRSGAGAKIGFEGGQMPLQRRLPKYGFQSRKARMSGELRLDALNRLAVDVIDLDALKAAGLLTRGLQRVKIIRAGQLDKPVVLRGLGVTKGARAAVEAAGGRIEE